MGGREGAGGSGLGAWGYPRQTPEVRTGADRKCMRDAARGQETALGGAGWRGPRGGGGGGEDQ